MPPNLNTISDNLILKRNDIYEKLYQHTIQRSNCLGRNDPRISSKPCQQIQLLEMIMGTELLTIQITIFGAILLIYMAKEFNK